MKDQQNYQFLLKHDKKLKNKDSFLSWENLINSGLSINKAIELKNKKFFKKVRTYIGDVSKDDEHDFIKKLKEDNFEFNKIIDLKNKALSNDIELIFTFINEYLEIKSKKNHNIEYWTYRGWDLETAKENIKNFFNLGPNSIEEKRKDPQYNNWYKKTRCPGGEQAAKTNSGSIKSQNELEILNELSLKGHNLNENFHSPVNNDFLYQIKKKRNFLHDSFIDDKFIFEYNGTYWHSDFLTFEEKFMHDDYMIEIIKAYNCLYEVNRKKDINYILAWENDFKSIEEYIDFIEDCLEDGKNKSGEFYSTREIDHKLLQNYKTEKRKEAEEKELFKDIVLTFSKKSKCESKKVASIAVKNGRIISSGINGTPSGYINCCDYMKNLHKYYKIEQSYEEWKKTDEFRELHHAWSNEVELHSEMNLIADAAKRGAQLKDCDIYVSLEPCQYCIKLLIALSPRKIFFVNSYDKSVSDPKDLLNSNNILFEQLDS